MFGGVKLKIKDYGEEICRILNPWQHMLYLSHGIKQLDEYVSTDSKGNYVSVHVYSKNATQELFRKFRNHELDIGIHVESK
jgi:hypothetical protein